MGARPPGSDALDEMLDGAPDDEGLARRAAAADESAFEARVGRFREGVVGVARRLTGCRSAAERRARCGPFWY